MKLEDKFFSTFFYPFFIGIFTSIIIVIVVLAYYSKGFLDETTANDVKEVETKYARNNIYSANLLLSDLLIKIKLVVEEQLSYFQLAEKNLNLSEPIENRKIKDVYSVFETPENNNELKDRLDYASLWFVDPNINNPKENEDLYNQIYLVSLTTQSMYAGQKSLKGLITKFYFIFEDTNVFIAYPYRAYWDKGRIESFRNYTSNPSWCTDNYGDIINYYKFRCREYYNDIIKAKTSIFDNNLEEQKNRKIFITAPYSFFVGGDTASFTMCIEFKYNLSNTIAYICVDIEGNNLFNTFNQINDKLIGYITISSVGFNKQFYFPNIISLGMGKTLGEYIFNFDIDYYLEEKIHFLTNVQKQITSNYLKNYNASLKEDMDREPLDTFNEIYINNENGGEEQYFYVDDELYEYSIYPIILENHEGQKEHVLSIIYIYKETAFYEYIFDFEEDTYSQLALQLILFVFFGGILLYIILLSFKILAKYIVIPIKNVHYMLEGINVGGEYRLEYLTDLKRKQEDNLEKLNKINRELSKKKKEKKENFISDLTEDNNNYIKQNNIKDLSNTKDTEFNDKTKSNLLSTEDNNKNKKSVIINEKTISPINTSKIEKDDDKLITTTNNEINLNEDDNMNNIDYDGEIIDPKINYDKQYDLEGDKIEKELNFYDFDEELLQYRPVEVDRLVRSLLNLKSALLLTSSQQDLEQIIGYSNSEHVFSNFKNKEGSRMCQSNIGNLESQLAKYDKAIYHLALSLQNIELKKFLSQTLSDEFDDGDILLHKLEISYGKEMKGEELNKLVKKQQKKGKNKKISQNFIEILINSRYNKLINFYYKFFSSIQKSNYNYEKFGGFFANTNFHTINNYHKVLIQYIYLCFISNDLVKIGESILDYIEFLIKFKLKTSKANSYILNINNKEFSEINEMQLNKKKYFDKIINWFSLFDNYAKQINENSALGNFKDVIDAYIHNLQSNQSDLDSGNQSALLFQVNLQRCDFLKGKFALVCKNYSDALGFLISAAKKKRIVIDGLIKKRALKHIAKIAEKTKKAIISNNYSKFNYYEIFEKINNNNDAKSIKSRKNNKSLNSFEEEEKKEISRKFIKLIDKIKELIGQVREDIDETNEKQLKDIITLIDCNLSTKLTVESYMDVVKTILKNYLTNNDRLGVFLLENEQRIICPMASKDEIDIINFSKDLDITIENLFKKEKIELSSFNEIIQEKNDVDQIYSEKNSEEESFSVKGFIGDQGFINDKGISAEDTIKSINYCLTYLKMKEISTNEKYFIYFNSNMKTLMDFLSKGKVREAKKKNKLRKEPKINFLLVGKFDKINEKLYNDILGEYFGSKSEVIPFDNMKNIKSILSWNNIINVNITFPNEVYKG